MVFAMARFEEVWMTPEEAEGFQYPDFDDQERYVRAGIVDAKDAQIAKALKALTEDLSPAMRTKFAIADAIAALSEPGA